MPGLNYCFIKESHKELLKKSKNVLSNLLSLEHLFSDILLEDNYQVLSSITYNTYPIKKIENENLIIYIEGKVYNLPPQEFEDQLFIHLGNLELSKDKYDDFNHWLETIDADILIFSFHKKNGSVIIFNDSLGRLPSYYFENNKSLIVSRNTRFVREILESKNFNKMGLAQSLLFGYALGTSTIFKDIQRFKPGTIIKINLFDNQKSEIVSFPRNFEEKYDERLSKKKIYEDLTDLFVEGCKNRSKSNKNVLSLSGGLDSRLVAAGLSKGGDIFTSLTLNDPWKDGEEIGLLETQIAEQVSNLCNSKCNVINVKPATGKLFLELLNIKDGNNNLGMSYFLGYLREIQTIFGTDITFFTGDGGDKSVKYQLPVRNLKSYDSLIDYILKIHSFFSIEQVSKFTGIEIDRLRLEIEQILKAFPEKDFNYKYVHFIFSERVNNWLNEGEDRNRYYFWSVTPFYSTQFFDYSMKIRDNLKIRNKAYRELLLRLNPQLLEIKYANINWPINSLKAKTYLFVKDKYNSLPYNSRNFIRKIVKKEKDISKLHYELKDKVYDQFNNTPEINEYFSVSEIKKIPILSPDQLKMLFNLTSVIEYFFSTESVLQKNFNNQLSFR